MHWPSSEQTLSQSVNSESLDRRYPWRWLDGTFFRVQQPFPWTDEWGAIYGGHPFGRLRIINGRLIALQRHIKRFVESCKFMCFEIAHTAEQLCLATIQTCIKNDAHDGYITIDAYLPADSTQPMAGLGIYNPAVTKAVISIAIIKFDEYLGVNAQATGINCCLADRPRNTDIPAGVKIGRYQVARRAKARALQLGCQEALFTFEKDFGDVYLSDGSAAELLVIHKDEPNTCFIVPNTHGILGGITRDICCAILEKKLGFMIRSEPIPWGWLISHQIQELALVGTATYSVPVCNILNPAGDKHVWYPIGTGKPQQTMSELGSSLRKILIDGTHDYGISNLFTPVFQN